MGLGDIYHLSWGAASKQNSLQVHDTESLPLCQVYRAGSREHSGWVQTLKEQPMKCRNHTVLFGNSISDPHLCHPSLHTVFVRVETNDCVCVCVHRHGKKNFLQWLLLTTEIIILQIFLKTNLVHCCLYNLFIPFAQNEKPKYLTLHICTIPCWLQSLQSAVLTCQSRSSRAPSIYTQLNQNMPAAHNPHSSTHS